MKFSSTGLLVSVGILFALQGQAAPSAPQLTVSTEGLNINASWTASPGAAGYTLFYAPKPYTSVDSVRSVDMGGNRSFSATLWNGASYYVAIKAYDNSGSSPYSNITDFTLLSAADIESAWLVNNSNKRSAFIFENSAHTTGALVNVESVVRSGNSVTVKASGIPNYQVVVDQALLTKLGKQPSGDFSSGPNVAVGDAIKFGQNIGYRQSPIAQSCLSTGGTGYWPPGPDCPQDTNKSKTFSATPSPASGVCATSTAAIGYMVNGTSIYNWSDAQVDKNIWQRNAAVFEAYDVDICGGHAAHSDYHHHFYTQCLADTVGDKGNGHSPVYGFANDGYPIYGPWYADGVLAVSSWVVRDYSDKLVGCSDGQRSCVMVDALDPSKGTVAASSVGYNLGYEASVTPSFRNGTVAVNAGAYYEDMYWDSGLAANGGKYLDKHNGHDHDNLGYHYHITVTRASDGSLTPAFPYIVGPTYYGKTSNCN
ncbi:MAG: YHYH protein [Methylobacter sp.]